MPGSQQQRVPITHAMLQNPEVLMADELIASLDPRATREVMDLQWLHDADLANGHLGGLMRNHYSQPPGRDAGQHQHQPTRKRPSTHPRRFPPTSTHLFGRAVFPATEMAG